MRIFVLIIFVLVPVELQAEGMNEFFENKVRPLLHEHCAACHGETLRAFASRISRAKRATALAAARQHRLAEQNFLGRVGVIGRVRGHAHRRLQPWRLVGPQHGVGQSHSENQERCFLTRNTLPMKDTIRILLYEVPF